MTLLSWTNKPLRRLEGDIPLGRRSADWTPRTDFQRWVKPRLKWPDGSEMSYGDLARELIRRGIDVSENHVYRVVRGNPEKIEAARRPGYELALAIGEFLGDSEGAITAAGYKALKPEGTVVVSNNDDPLSRIGPDIDTTILRRIPFIPGPVSASMTRVGEGENVGPLQTAADVLPNDVRAIEVRGESMEPVYRSGDILFVQEARTAHDGDEVIAVIGLDGITCKTYREPPEGLGYLQPYNGEAKIEFPNFIIVGIVVGFYRHKQRRPN